MVKKYLVLVFAIFLLAGNAYANSIDLTGEWAVTANCSWGDNQTATYDRFWTIVDDLIDNTFGLEYSGTDWYSMPVSGDIDPISGDHDGGNFAYIRPSDSALYVFNDFHFSSDGGIGIVGETDIMRYAWTGSDFDWPNGVSMHCDYTGRPVPEPATMLLLGSGLVGLAGFGRKRFKK